MLGQHPDKECLTEIIRIFLAGLVADAGSVSSSAFGVCLADVLDARI